MTVILFTSGGPTYVSETEDYETVKGNVNAGAVFDFADIGGSTFSINPTNVVAVLERNDA